jgi:hypothetical protein
MRSLVKAFGRLAAPALVLALAVWPQAASADPALIMAQVQFANAGVVLAVNGVPALAVGEDPDAKEYTGDGRGLLSTWMVAGANKIEAQVRKRGAAAIKVTVTVVARDVTEPLAKEEITTAGVKTLSIDAKELPRWSWQDATAWDGKDDEVIAAVTKFHEAVAAKDDAAVSRTTAAFWADMKALFGPAAAGAHMAFKEALAKSTIRPMPPLRVTRYQNGQIIHVGAADGTPDAPVSADFGDGERLETGEWWSLIGGSWQVIH